MAATGLLTEDGALDVDAYADPVTDPAYVDLTALIEQILGEGASDTLLSEATVQIGAVGSQIAKNGADVTSLYRVADLEANLTSPLVGNVDELAADVVDGATATLDAALGEGGAVHAVVDGVVSTLDALSVAGTGVTASLDSFGIDTGPLLQSVTDELLLAPLDNSTEGNDDATVSIDLSTGTITADLGALLLASDAEYTDLSDLPANTDVLSDDVINALTEGVASALTGTGPNSLTSKVVSVVAEGIYDVNVNLDISAGVSALGDPVSDTTTITLDSVDADGAATGPATLGGILGIAEYDSVEVSIANDDILGPLVGLVEGVLNDLVTGLSGALGPVIEGIVGESGIVDTLQPAINGVLNPVVTSLVGTDEDPGALEGLLNAAADLTINAQPAVGDFGDGSSTVRALNVMLLPLLGDGAVTAELASSTVKAADAYDTAITIEPGTIEQGETTTITGTGFALNETVAVTIDGESIGTATTNENGEFTLDYTAPDDSRTDTFDVVATGEVSQTPAEGTLIIEPSDAGADPAADADADVNGDVNTNASSSAAAAAAADADDESNASAQAAAQAAANADADTAASAAADADATAAAQSAANSNASAAAAAASNADSSADASSEAASSADSDSASNANASSASNGQQISMELENDRLMVGQEQVAHGHGFQPGESVTAAQHSTTYDIGTAVADDNGDVTFTWSVPNGTEDGSHVVELTGETSGSVDATFEVYSTGGGGLSPTDGDMALPLGGLAAAMLLAGAGVWFAVRRRANA
ncbi:MAG: choice-of-anchor G family protein [Microbacteriaceae bacterium]